MNLQEQYQIYIQILDLSENTKEKWRLILKVKDMEQKKYINR